MVAQTNMYLEETAQTLYKMNADEMVRPQCLARMDYEREQARQRWRQENDQREIATLKKTVDAQLLQLADKDTEIANKDAEIAALKAQLQSRQ